MRKYPMTIQMLAAAFLIALLAGCAGHHGTQARSFQLDPAQVPTPYHTLVDIEFVKPLVFEAMLSATPPTHFMIVDSRPKQPRYDKGHIPTAVSLPDGQFDKLAGELLPGDKTTLLVFYCGGLHCPLSHQSAWKAEALGYTDVAVYPAGDPEWVERGYVVWTADGPSRAAATAPAPAKAEGPEKILKPGSSEGTVDVDFFVQLMRDNPDSILLIDVRSPAEFEAGHIPSAVNMPINVLEEKIDTFTNEKPIVFICSTGARSGEAYYMFDAMRSELNDVYYVDANVGYTPAGEFSIN